MTVQTLLIVLGVLALVTVVGMGLVAAGTQSGRGEAGPVIAATVALTCSSCDDYRLIEGEDGMLVRCPDCLHVTANRCPVHGRSVRLGGKCPECSYEAVAAQESIEHGVGVAADPIAEALYGY